MPRIKSMTSGSQPNFLDAVLNIAEVGSNFGQTQDNWLTQMFHHGKKIKFFGDETWISLFSKEMFFVCEGTNSLFATVDFRLMLGHCDCRFECDSSFE